MRKRLTLDLDLIFQICRELGAPPPAAAHLPYARQARRGLKVRGEVERGGELGGDGELRVGAGDRGEDAAFRL